MFKIQTLNAISASGLNQFSAAHYTIASDIAKPDAILVRSQNMHSLVLPPSVRVVGRAGVGVNNIPVAALTQAGIPVLNTPNANANAVKELVLAGMLLASRNLCQSWEYVKGLQISSDVVLNQHVEHDKKRFVGVELMGKTLGIIGLGAIGVKVANTAIALGMRVIGYDPAVTVKRAWELSASVQQAHDIDVVFAQADFVSLHIPLMDETRQLINAARIQAMKPSSVLLNFAREEVVDQQALLTALNAKKLSVYVNDFPTQLLKDHPRVLSLPHLGASTQEAEENCAIMIAKQVSAFLEYGTISNSVNFPAVELAYTAGVRIAIVNANVPNMVGQISSILAAAGLNIIDLINKSKDNIAYTLIDVDAPVADKIIAEIATINGVVQARVLIG